MGCLAGCGILPDEFNVSPLYRHRVGPDGQLAEFDLLWPLFHYERDDAGTTDFRVRPIWRRVEDASGTRIRHEFISPLGAYHTDGRETTVRFLPLFYYREHEHEGRPGSWDRDWYFTPLIWGGSSAEGEDYLAVFPIFGSIPQFMGYDRLGFFLFPLSLWTSRGSSGSFSFLWPLMGWGGSDERDARGQPTKPYWFRILPFFGYSIHPGKSESYSALWPLFHWGTERMHTKEPYSKFFFFPIIGWKTGGAFLSWTFLWPFFRHTHRVQGRGGSVEGDYSYWDFPWPLFRSMDNTWDGADQHQWWIFPLISKAWSRTKESLVLLWPLIRFRRFLDALSVRTDSFVLPLWWSYRTRYRRVPVEDATAGPGEEESGEFLEGEDRGWRVLPLAGYREERTGTWRYRVLDPWPAGGAFAAGVYESYDWAWTLWESRGDGQGNRRVRALADLYTSRHFAGRRFQASVPFLFNLVSEEDGETTLRLFQFLPIRWGGGGHARSVLSSSSKE